MIRTRLRTRGGGGGSGSGGDSWSPTDILGLEMWSDASDTATITDTGTMVWADKSGNGRDWSQATGANKPGTTTINGLNALTGNGTSQYMTQSAFITALANKTIFMVVGGSAQQNKTFLAERRVSTSNPSSAFCGSNTSASPYNKSRAYYRSDGNTDMLNVTGTEILLDGTTKILCITDTGTHYKSWINGVPDIDTTYTAHTRTVDLLGIFANPRTPAEFFNGFIGETYVYDSILSDAEIDESGGYLEDKWGATWTPISASPAFYGGEAALYGGEALIY